MRLVKPLWLKHGGEKKDFEVYSCSVSTDGQRLVTAAGDGNIRIWSTEAIYNGTDSTYDKPKQLAALNYHTGTIHTVRFSPNNRFLASGADDKIVCVYYLDPSAPAHTTFGIYLSKEAKFFADSGTGSNEAPPVENWRIHRRLIGHDNDVQDLGWSPDSSILVTVGLDSKIVVWSGHTFEKLKTISQHGSHVKGVTFDPANKYFATASDDRTMKIFRYTPPEKNASAYDHTNNFMLEATISEPFSTSPLTTYFRRCSWSPDGNHIAAANATNGPVSVVAIVERGTWDSAINFVGHEGPVEVCAFSPRIFNKTPINNIADAASGGGITVIACAGQDRNLSVWNTVTAKPFTVTENLTLKSITDLAWSPDGETLFFTSLDGTIAMCRFTEGELGYPMPFEANDLSLQRFGASRKVGMVEGPDGLLLEDQSKNDELKTVQGRMGELMGDAPSAAAGSTPAINGFTHANGVTNGDALKDIEMTGSAVINGTAAGTPQPTPEESTAARVEKLKHRVTYTKEGKKRIAPILLDQSAGIQSSLPQTQLMSAQQQSVRSDAPQNILDLSKPFDGFPKGGLTSLFLGNKRKYAETGEEDDDFISQRVSIAQQTGATSILMNTTEGLTLPAEAVARPGQVSSNLSISQIRLAIPAARPTIQRPLSLQTDQGDQTQVMDVRNASGPSRTGRVADRDPARITVTKRGQLLWQDFLPKAVSLVTANSRFWALTCEDGTLHVWSPAGRRLFNAFALESQVSILDCRGPWLLAITAVGICHVWNIERSTSPHPPISLGPALEIAASSQGPHLGAGPGIIFARLTSQGRVILAMSNGDAFAYSTSLYTWQRLSEAWWAVGSQYWNSSDAQLRSSFLASGDADPEDGDMVRAENISAGVLSLLERNTNNHTQARGRAFHLQRLIKALFAAEGFEGLESAVSVAHLENRVAGALTLGAKEEFRVYLNMYAKRLGQENARLKIEELLRSLLRGVDAQGDGAGQAPFPGRGSDTEGGSDELCGWKKETLLREVILILGKYRDLQRITVPYARLLDMTKTMGEKAGAVEENGMNPADDKVMDAVSDKVMNGS